jgi:hypothetical protein
MMTCKNTGKGGHVMTVTDTYLAETESAPFIAFAITTKAKAFLDGLRNVHTVAAGTDDTLPSLCGVMIEMAEDGTLTFAATNRYCLAYQDLTLDPESFTGDGSVLLTKEIVKHLLAARGVRDWELITVTVNSRNDVTVAMPDTSVVTFHAGDVATFPNWRKLSATFKELAEDDKRPASCGYNAGYLAKFAKIAKSANAVGELVTLTPMVNNLTRIDCGDVHAWLMQIRKNS